MRETSFIKQNKEKWVEFEENLTHNSTDPDKLNDLFIQITDDLSYSRTFYPNRSVRVYLNNLAQQIFHSIYKTRKSRLNRFANFWKAELPRLVYESRNEFRLSLFVFTLAFLIGALSSTIDPEFPRVILGDDYVDMTIENIESGDPMAVYKQRGEFGMSLGITANNLFVAFLTFVLGVFFAIGTLAIMVKNGVMVGAFQYFFYEEGVFWESFLTIWTHGTLEISAIIIAGAAGLTMGKGLVFPGTYSRLQAFQVSARRGIKIMVGIVPIIIMAGFIEGFLTRNTETPDIIRLLFILVCLFSVLGYFVWYPKELAKKGFKNKISESKIPPNTRQYIQFNRIKAMGEIFSDTFVFYKKYLVKIGLFSFITTILFCGVVFLSNFRSPSELFVFDSVGISIGLIINQLKQFFTNDQIMVLPFMNVLLYSAITFILYTLLVKEEAKQKKEEIKQKTKIQHLSNFLQSSVIIILLMTVIYFAPSFAIFVVLLMPCFLLWAYIMYREQKNIIGALGRTVYLIQSNLGRMFSLFSSLLMIGLFFYSFVDSFLFWFYIEVISWNLSLEQETLDQLVIVLLTFSRVLVICLVYSMMAIGIGLIYYTLLEIKEAPDLKERIKKIGQGRRIQGLEREA